jgi:predicted nucleic-acid-binding Zn-ribbon protein
MLPLAYVVRCTAPTLFSYSPYHTLLLKKIIVIIALSTGTALAVRAQQPPKHTDTTAHVLYTCPMHPEVISKMPEKCPKCGMKLVLQKKQVADIYTCLMHPEVISDQPGKCPKCGMTLAQKKTADPTFKKM